MFKEYGRKFFGKFDAFDETSLKEDLGKVFEEHGKKVAAYKSKDGKVVKVSAVCTHLGCIVNWNDDQKSWDCPCHGSRYTSDGKVINGPATNPLEKI